MDNGKYNPMFINRISSFPIVQQSVQAIKSTSIGNLADRTLKRVASTRLPVISVPKLPSIPIIGKKDKEADTEKSDLSSHSITLEDATKSIPGLATMDNIGCKTLDKIEENFPMINDPELLKKIIDRLEELREIGENTYVVQSSLNSLQNMQNRLNHYNSLIVKKDNSSHCNKKSSIKHRHSFSIASAKRTAATSSYHNKNFSTCSNIQTSSFTAASGSFESINECGCCCKCHQKHRNNSVDIQRIIQQQQENLIKSTNQISNDIQPKKQELPKSSRKLSIISEISNIRSNLKANINSIPNTLYGRVNNVLTAIEKKIDKWYGFGKRNNG